MARARNVRVVTPEPSADWPELLGRLVDDFATIIATEIKISGAGVERAIEASLNRTLARAAVAILALYGLAYFSVAGALLLHRWMELWLAVTVIGFIILTFAGLGYFVLTRSSKTQHSTN